MFESLGSLLNWENCVETPFTMISESVLKQNSIKKTTTLIKQIMHGWTINRKSRALYQKKERKKELTTWAALAI